MWGHRPLLTVAGSIGSGFDLASDTELLHRIKAETPTGGHGSVPHDDDGITLGDR
jgi:hypothetical protein